MFWRSGDGARKGGLGGPPHLKRQHPPLAREWGVCGANGAGNSNFIVSATIEVAVWVRMLAVSGDQVLPGVTRCCQGVTRCCQVVTRYCKMVTKKRREIQISKVAFTIEVSVSVCILAVSGDQVLPGVTRCCQVLPGVTRCCQV